MVADAHGAGSHGQTAGLNSRAAEGDEVGGTELFVQAWHCPDGAGKVRSQPCGANPIGRRCQEFSAFHKASTESFFCLGTLQAETLAAGQYTPASLEAEHNTVKLFTD